ncbi:g1330 [Coccomyxa viridis]|uniref:Meiotic nuclear division protein 1 homolog n=1 Tax=Coccomyxa viridis TaxID=1274662 RepID=A0ABP1FHS1_9CHLO
MSKKRGLSIDEKKQKVLEIFHESKDVFVLKDIEKLAPKKGVVLQSVKEVVQALVDDDLVHQDKIGASNFFWSFPSEAAVKLKTECKRREQELADLEKQDTSLSAQIEESKMGKEDSEDRKAKLEKMEQLQEALSKVQKEVAQYADSDPTRVEAMRVAAELAKSSANRWLDNTWALESWCKKRFQGMEETLGNFFRENGLTEDMDYIA